MIEKICKNLLNKIPETSVEYSYIAKFKNIKFERDALLQNSCFMPISPDNPNHYGLKYLAIINLVNRSFQSCFIILSDSLKRYNFRINNPNLTEQEARKMGYKLCKEWISQNQIYTDQFKIPYEIISWDHWLNDPKYPIYREKVQDLYLKDNQMRQLVGNMVYNYLNSYIKSRNGNKVEEERIKNLSIEYVLEEVVIQMLMIPYKFPNAFFIYPKTHRLDALIHLHEYITHQQCRWLKILISRKEQR